jgi:hypothetical protein
LPRGPRSWSRSGEREARRRFAHRDDVGTRGVSVPLDESRAAFASGRGRLSQRRNVCRGWMRVRRVLRCVRAIDRWRVVPEVLPDFFVHLVAGAGDATDSRLYRRFHQPPPCRYRVGRSGLGGRLFRFDRLEELKGKPDGFHLLFQAQEERALLSTIQGSVLEGFDEILHSRQSQREQFGFGRCHFLQTFSSCGEVVELRLNRGDTRELRLQGLLNRGEDPFHAGHPVAWRRGQRVVAAFAADRLDDAGAERRGRTRHALRIANDGTCRLCETEHFAASGCEANSSRIPDTN